MKYHPIITLGRMPGSGGHLTGQLVAQKLGMAFFDKELIQLASMQSGLGKEVFEKADEKSGHSIFGGMFGMRNSLFNEVYSGYLLSNEGLFQIQSDVIREQARLESSLFVGRCADYVLKDQPMCLNVFVTANKNDRIARLAALHQLSEKDALAYIEKEDKRRSSYYNYFSNKKWGAAESYHLCINTSVVGIENAAELIVAFSETWMKKAAL
jgi:hypothetical protein